MSLRLEFIYKGWILSHLSNPTGIRKNFTNTLKSGFALINKFPGPVEQTYSPPAIKILIRFSISILGICIVTF